MSYSASSRDSSRKCLHGKGGALGGFPVGSPGDGLGTHGPFPDDIPGMILPVGVTRDTWRNRSVLGESTRETRVALGGFRGISFSRLAAHSEAFGRVLSAWVLGTRGVLARHPKHSLGEALGAGFSGTRGSLELLPDVPSRIKH